MAFNFRKMFGKEDSDEYVELDMDSAESKENKIRIMPFVLKQFEDINNILNHLRGGYTIVIIDIKPLKTKDVIELKRAVSKIKKTVDALEGAIAGFGENTIIATPKFVEIHREPAKKREGKTDFLH